MKRSVSYITSVISLFSGAILCAADLDITEDTSLTTRTAYDYINFNANSTLSYGEKIRLTINKGIKVAEGVNAVLQNISTTDTSRIATSSEDITITGAGADKSSLHFMGRFIDGGIDGGDNPQFTTSLFLKDIKFEMTRRQTTANALELKSLIAENSIIQIHKKLDTSTGTETFIKVEEGISLDNSQLILDSSAQLTLYTNTAETMPIALNNSTMDINGALIFSSNMTPIFNFSGNNILKGNTAYTLKSAIINDGASIRVSGGNKTFTTIDNNNGLTNATLEVDASSTLTVSNSTTNLKAQNSNIIAYGDFNASSTQFDFSGVNSISGSGTVNLKANLGTSQLYITAKNFNTGKELYVNSKNAIASIGQDVEGNKSAVNFSGNIQADSGALIVTGGSIINSSGTGRTFVINNGANATIDNATIYAGSSRICAGNFNAHIETNNKNIANGWNYSLAFGAYSTTGTNRQANDVVLGANASTNVNANSATYFGIYGTVTSNVATEGALKSNANAPLMIYDDTTLTLNSTDAFAVGGAASQADSTFNFFDGSTSTLVVNKENNIGSFNFGSGATLTLELGENGSLVLGESSATSLAGTLVNDMITLSGDVYQKVKVFNLSDAQINQYFTSANGIFLQDAGNGAYWINTVVPEPAEWATIFGALALGFVAYRRKK